MSDFQKATPPASAFEDVADVSPTATLLVRVFGWSVISSLVVFMVNDYLTFWWGLPGARSVFDGSAIGWVQLAAYPVCVLGVAYAVQQTASRTLREDSARLTRINTFIVRAAFFAVLYVGLVDAAISFIRVEGLLSAVFGDQLALELGRSTFRGVYVHIPLIFAGIVTACFSRSLGFIWLALLVVGAELLIVMTRFIFSYEQAFMSDLVRFWYAALFLFGSAYTLLEEGHVRVDVLYTNFSPRAKGRVNAVGSVLLGLTICWVILIIGMGEKTAIINSPILSFETTQTGFGMYVKYLMAGYLAFFASTMMIQFVSYFMESVADFRGEPGGRGHESHDVT